MTEGLPRSPQPEEISNKRLEKLVTWTREVSQPVQGLLVPVNGETDSALSFWVCNKARPGEVLGVRTEEEPGEGLKGKEWLESVGPIELVETQGDFVEREEMRWASFLNISIVKDYALVGSRTRPLELLTLHHNLFSIDICC